ncbi:hypothetical protein [Alkanindiges illinoisensis]|uniref:hypothetical protein n=1 Tax=Alkanindiges illinoisensis TaxID=197183 RepID=UPI000479E45E|nr:hypothetical protein [Alkanindiges illinoisensis]
MNKDDDLLRKQALLHQQQQQQQNEIPVQPEEKPAHIEEIEAPRALDDAPEEDAQPLEQEQDIIPITPVLSQQPNQQPAESEDKVQPSPVGRHLP